MHIINSHLSRLCLIISLCLFISACANHQAKSNFVSEQGWQQATDKVHHQYAEQVEQSLKPYFSHANLSYPPQQIAMLTFKKEQIIELWAKENNSNWQYIRNYPLTAFSGELGPKLNRNDGQIPEGIYQITHFNPFSSQHLSMMLDYPNQIDKQYAQIDGRSDLGDNIFIHGKAKSVGCLAIGDKAIDELFVLVKEVGKENTKVIIAPNDLRKSKALANKKHHPRWLAGLYSEIAKQLEPFSTKA